MAASTTGVVPNDESIVRAGAISATLASLAHDCSDGTRAFAHASTAGRVELILCRAIEIAGAEVARLIDGKKAETVWRTFTAATRIEDSAVLVDVTGFGAAFAFATLVSGNAVGDGACAAAVEAGVCHTGVVVLAAAVSMRFAGLTACSPSARLSDETIIRTFRLRRRGHRSSRHGKGDNRQRGASERAPIASPGETPRECIESPIVHTVPATDGAGRPHSPGPVLRRLRWSTARTIYRPYTFRGPALGGRLPRCAVGCTMRPSQT